MTLSRKHIFSENLRLGYLEGGSNTLFTKILEKIENMGGRLITHSEVEKIVIKKDRVSGVVFNGKEHSFDMAVSTIPIPYIKKMVPGLPPNVISQYKKVNNIGIVCAIFKLKYKISDFFWLNTYDQRIKIPGIIEFSNLRPFKHHIIYYPHYLPKNHDKFFQPDEIFFKEALECFEIINPTFKNHWVLDAAVSRSEYAQPICPPGFLKSLPPVKTTIKGLYIADTSYYYPEDRSISESIGLAKKISKIIIEDEEEDKNGPGKNI